MSQDNLKIELEKIDARISSLKNDIELGNAVNELHADEKFIKVFVEGYFKAEEERLASLLFNPTSLKREQIENVMDKATGIRNLKIYLDTLGIAANMAPDQIAEEEEYRTKLNSQNAIETGE